MLLEIIFVFPRFLNNWYINHGQIEFFWYIDLLSGKLLIKF